MSEKITRANIPALEMGMSPGSACQGCGGALSARIAFKALGPNAIRLMIPCCPDMFTNHPMAVGVFEGGGYVSKGVYRPTFNSIMNSFTSNEFNEVCKEVLQKIINSYSE